MCMCRAYTVGFIFKGNVNFHRRNEETITLTAFATGTHK